MKDSKKKKSLDSNLLDASSSRVTSGHPDDQWHFGEIVKWHPIRNCPEILRSKMEGGNAAKADMKLAGFFVERKNGGQNMEKGARKVVCWVFFGRWNPTQLCRDYFISHEIRIPSLNNQDSMESILGFFSFLKCLGVKSVGVYLNSHARRATSKFVAWEGTKYCSSLPKNNIASWCKWKEAIGAGDIYLKIPFLIGSYDYLEIWFWATHPRLDENSCRDIYLYIDVVLRPI